MSGGGRFDAFWAALDTVPVADDAEALYDVSTTAGREHAERLSWERSAEGLEDVYRRVLGRA